MKNNRGPPSYFSLRHIITPLLSLHRTCSATAPSRALTGVMRTGGHGPDSGTNAHSVGPCPRTLVCHSHVRACSCARVTHAHFRCPPRLLARMSLHARQTAKHIFAINLPAAGHESNTRCHAHCHVPYSPQYIHNTHMPRSERDRCQYQQTTTTGP